MSCEELRIAAWEILESYGVGEEDTTRLVLAVERAQAEMLRLEGLCRVAAREIDDHWEAHCDEEGYGPVNLMNRLTGKQGGGYPEV